MQIRTSVLQRGCPECYHRATQDNTCTILLVTPLTQLMKTHVAVLLARPAPPLSIRLLDTILVGIHFPPKINDDCCLAFYINPSSMGSSPRY